MNFIVNAWMIDKIGKEAQKMQKIIESHAFESHTKEYLKQIKMDSDRIKKQINDRIKAEAERIDFKLVQAICELSSSEFRSLYKNATKDKKSVKKFKAFLKKHKIKILKLDMSNLLPDKKCQYLIFKNGELEYSFFKNKITWDWKTE